MKTLTKIFIITIAFISCFSCKNISLKQTVSGKAGEIIIVSDKEYWESDPGFELRSLLAKPYPYLPQKEASFTLIDVTPKNFSSILKIHRNIIILKINPELKSKITINKDVWAAPQIVINLTAPTKEDAAKLILEKSELIFNAINQIERDRIISNAKRYEEVELRKLVTDNFGGSPYFPKGYSLKKKTDDFIWISYEPTYTIQGILMYKIPYIDSTSLEAENLITAMGDVMKKNVPGMVDNSYMIFSDKVTPGYQWIKYKGKNFIELRGLWDVQNDFMGGPFIVHAFHDKNNPNYITIVQGFVYAARFDKRNYLRQVEAILYSFENENDSSSNKKNK